MVTKDKLDLYLSVPYFVTPVSNNKTRQIFAFKNQMDSEGIMSESSRENFNILDDCFNQSYQTETFSIADLIQGGQPKRQKTDDLRPMLVAFICFTVSLGKAKPVTGKALLDSGASDAIAN